MRSSKNRRNTIIVAGTWSSKSCNQQFQAFCLYAARKGYRVFFVSDRNKHPTYIDHENITVLNWPNYSPRSFRDLFFIIRLIFKIRPKTTISNFSSVPFVSIAAYINMVPCRIAFIHSTFDVRGAGFSSFRKFIRSWIYKLNNRIIAVSTEIGDQSAKLFNIKSRKISILNNSVPFKIQLDRVKRKNIITVAALEAWKGVDLLIEAFGAIHDQIPEYRLIIIGEGTMKDNLLNMVDNMGIQKKVEFKGVVPFQKVQEMLAESEIFVLPSRADGSPQSVLEASIQQCTVIASSVGGIPDMIIDKKTGILLSKEQIVPQLKVALVDLCHSEQKRRDLVDHAQNHLHSHFGMEAWANKLLDISEELR